MRKIGLEEILNGLCDEILITPGNSPHISYRVFRRAMLASDLFTTENAIKIRWQQLLVSDELLEGRGINQRGEETIRLNPHNVYAYIKAKGVEPHLSLTLSHTASEEDSQ